MFKNVVIASVVSVAFLGTSWAFWQEATPTRPSSDRDSRGAPGGFSFFGSSAPTMSLLRIREVQTELKLEDAKTKKLDEINAEAIRERSRLITELNAKIAELNKKAEADAMGLLSNAQRQRAEQLLLQQQGVRALSTTAVADKLGLTQAQRDEIAKLNQRTSRFGTDRTPLANPPDPNIPAADRFRQAAEESAKRAAETREKILAILTPEQKAKWSELTGEPFQFPSRSRSSTRSTRSSEPTKPGAEKKDQ